MSELIKDKADLIKLKVCPFCGGDTTEDWAAAVHTSNGLSQTGWLECDDCGASVDYVVNDVNGHWSEGSAMLYDKWNQRTVQAKIAEQDEQIKELVKALDSALEMAINVDAHDVIDFDFKDVFEFTTDVLSKYQ